MGRRGGGRAAPSRPMSTAPAARPPPPRPAAAPPPAQRMQAAPPAQPGAQGPSMMTQMAGNVASVAAGSVIGHGISRAMFGSGSEQAAPIQEAPAQSEYTQPQAADACKFEFENFMQCLKSNNNDASQCQYFMDSLNQCRYNAGM